MQSVYATPAYISALDQVMPVAEQIKVDFEIRGCPVNTHQITTVLRSLLTGVIPVDAQDKLCLECKRQNRVCVMVSRGLPCMGSVIWTGCGVLCLAVGRDCYGCYGSAENVNINSLSDQFGALQLNPNQVGHRFLSFNSADLAFKSVKPVSTEHDD